MLGSQQRKTLFFFLDVIRMVLDEAQSVEQLDELETQMNVALALIERDFPITVQVCTYTCMYFNNYTNLFRL